MNETDHDSKQNQQRSDDPNSEFTQNSGDDNSPRSDELFARQCAKLRSDYESTRNPIYVWTAIRECRVHARSKFDEKHFNFPIDNSDESRAKFKKYYASLRDLEFPLPGWCLNYLFNVSHGIWDLERGLDRRIEPEIEYPRDVSKMMEFEESLEYAKYKENYHKWRRSPTLQPNDAVSRLAWIFGFVTRGWNAFNQQLNEEKALVFSDEHFGLCRQGMSANQAYGILAEKYEMDVRSIRRVIATYNKNFGREWKFFATKGPDKT